MQILLAIDVSSYTDACVVEVVCQPWPANGEVKIISASFRTWWTTCPPT
jgi:hypothetical protein